MLSGGGGGGEVEEKTAGATVTPAYLVEHTGRGFRGQVARTGALRLCAVAARLALHMFRRVLVEEEGGWWNRGYRGRTAKVEEPLGDEKEVGTVGLYDGCQFG